MRDENDQLANENSILKVKSKDMRHLENDITDQKLENKKLHDKIQSLLIEEKEKPKSALDNMDLKFAESKIETLNLMLDEYINAKSELDTKLEKQMVINQKLTNTIEEFTIKEEKERLQKEEDERKRLDKVYTASRKKAMESNLDQVPLADQMRESDNAFDQTNLHSCLKQILRLQVEKRDIANEYERYKAV